MAGTLAVASPFGWYQARNVGGESAEMHQIDMMIAVDAGVQMALVVAHSRQQPLLRA